MHCIVIWISVCCSYMSWHNALCTWAVRCNAPKRSGLSPSLMDRRSYYHNSCGSEQLGLSDEIFFCGWPTFFCPKRSFIMHELHVNYECQWDNGYSNQAIEFAFYYGCTRWEWASRELFWGKNLGTSHAERLSDLERCIMAWLHMLSVISLWRSHDSCAQVISINCQLYGHGFHCSE